MRYAVGLLTIAAGAVLALGVTGSPDGFRVQVIGLILLFGGLSGMAVGRWLDLARRRTDIIYGQDRATLLTPNAPPRGEARGPVRRHVSRPPTEPDPPTLPLRIPGSPDVRGRQRHRVHRRVLIPGARIVRDPRTDRVKRVHGVMDVEPGSEEFWRLARLYD